MPLGQYGGALTPIDELSRSRSSSVASQDAASQDERTSKDSSGSSTIGSWIKSKGSKNGLKGGDTTIRKKFMSNPSAGSQFDSSQDLSSQTVSYWDSHRLGVAPGVEYTKEEADAARTTRPLNYLQQLLLLRAADRSDGSSSKEKEKDELIRQQDISSSRQGNSRPPSRKIGANLDEIRSKSNNSREGRQRRAVPPPPPPRPQHSKGTTMPVDPKAKRSHSPFREKKKQTSPNSMPTKKSKSPNNRRSRDCPERSSKPDAPPSRPLERSTSPRMPKKPNRRVADSTVPITNSFSTATTTNQAECAASSMGSISTSSSDFDILLTSHDQISQTSNMTELTQSALGLPLLTTVSKEEAAIVMVHANAVEIMAAENPQARRTALITEVEDFLRSSGVNHTVGATNVNSIGSGNDSGDEAPLIRKRSHSDPSRKRQANSKMKKQSSLSARGKSSTRIKRNGSLSRRHTSTSEPEVEDQHPIHLANFA